MIAFFLAMTLMAAMKSRAGDANPSVDAGVSLALAAERASAIQDLRYDLTFSVPSSRNEPIRGRVVVSVTLRSPSRLVFDFAQPRQNVRSVVIDGADAGADFENGHIVVPARTTRTGVNRVEFEFVAGDEALNRNDEFLYTLFVPSRARLAFPCFDQPDLKARYRLRLSVPDGWQAVANGAERIGTVERGLQPPRGAVGSGSGTATIEFEETPPLPTYLLAFAAGKFSLETATRNGREFRMFHRETDAAKVARNRDALFDLHASALAWLEGYTSIPYPWGKFDFVLIPSFQFGGMEHAGAILYNASGLMLDESATQNQLLERASVIAHETAHMWFGDLVTMRWFDDVWLKEVFANFMAAKIVNPSFPKVNHELRFLFAHHPGAYQVDRTSGTNAIRQPLSNLDDAGQLYGAIIYQKAPVVMRQLELILGETAFRDGLREYLKRYSYGNATWADLVRILDNRTSRDLARWSRAWVEERGRPTFTTRLRMNERGEPDDVELFQDDPLDRGLVWPERLNLVFGFAKAARNVPVDVTAERTFVRVPPGLGRPLYVLPSADGFGYGLFLLDDVSRQYLLSHIEDIADPLARGAAWVAMWDNLIERRIAADQLLATALRALPRETDEQNAQRVLSYTTRLFWRYQSPDQRRALGTIVEAVLRAGIARAPTQSQKAAWFNAYRDTVLSAEGLAWLERVWRREEAVPGLTLAEPDEITLALELAVREVPRWEEILRTQAGRTQNPDRKARFEFVMPALSADPAVRERSFARLAAVENRRREPWVLESLQYLNHPLREAHARRFVPDALGLLREIQRTGDIFFPTRWMDSTLSGHNSPEVAAIVQDFLAKELQYPQRLRWTILTTADELLRISRS
jgi:aminopeptidase N